jgi:signal transduction histidine kinase
MNGDAKDDGEGRLPSVLLVDDEKAFADTLAFRLRSRGYGCLAAYSGEEALALLDRRELEVVLLDLGMPGMSGLEALRLIKEKRPDVEVALLTGEADFSAAATGMRRGAGDYLIKPVALADLLTALKKAGRRARERKERLRALENGKLLALGVLAAGVGHEINNPLQILLQRAEWMRELVEEAQSGAPDYAEMLKTAEVLQAQAKRAGEITAKLLDLAHRSRSGVTDAAELTRKAVGDQTERIAALGATVAIQADEALPLARCSPAELLAIVGHLLQNALDAIEAKAVPDETRAGKVGISLGQSGDSLCIRVDDSGEGITPGVAERMYEPFFSTRHERTGLGLSLCRTLVAGLGGGLEHDPAASPLGGARFTVCFPSGNLSKGQTI